MAAPPRRGAGRGSGGGGVVARPWPPCPPRVFGRGTQGRWEASCAMRHTAHDRAARRTTVDARRLGRRARRTADSPTPPAIPRPRPRGTAQPRSSAQVLAHTSSTSTSCGSVLSRPRHQDTRSHPRMECESHTWTYGHASCTSDIRSIGDIRTVYSAYGPRPVTACSSVPRVCRLTTVCRAAATPDTLVAHLNVT